MLLLWCCSCAIRSSCMCVSAMHSQVVQFHLEVGSCACILQQNNTAVLLLCGPTCSNPLLKTQAKGNVAGCTSGASSGPPASPPLLCCYSRATLIMYVCLCFVFPSCAVSPGSWGSCACILPQNLQFYCCVVPAVVTVVPNFKKTQSFVRLEV